MSNSSLISYTRISPNSTNPRNSTIKKITVHHQAGNLSLETLGNIVANPAREMSCNYGIDSQGRIGLYCEEKNRSWCSSSRENDHQAITIEVANDEIGGQWHVSDKAMESLIKLCVDICKRNGIAKLNFTGDKNGNLTAHRYFAATQCPGPYLYSKFPYIAEQVNKQLTAPSEGASGYTKIMGTAKATAAQMQAYIKKKNPSVAQSVLDMIPLYLSEGKAEGVRGDIAFAQSCLETGNFTFSGSAVTLSQNNFCGLGVTSNGVKGNSFATPQLGIRAQIQHLKAYACTDALNGACVDPRFTYVSRGAAIYVEYLGIQENPKKVGWAAGANYGTKILSILKDIIATTGAATSSSLYRVRKSWSDATSQIGAYSNLENAKAACKDDYYVFDENGNIVYPITNSGFSVGDEVKLAEDAKYIDGSAIPSWIVNSKVYVREIRDNGDIVFSIAKTGAVTGVASKQYFVGASGFKEYQVKVTADALNIRSGPGTSYSKTGCITDKGVYTIVAENGTWGKLKSGAGWISLNYTEKL